MPELYDTEEEKKFLYRKKISCANCDSQFEDIRVLNTKLRRLESDKDLRPRFQGIDSVKYGVTVCPYCGYAASAKNFEHMSKLQRKLVREKISEKFVQREFNKGDTLSYPEAIEQYKLALICALAMDAKLSDQAYLCLQISWLMRGYLEQGGMSQNDKAKLTEDAERFYHQAFDGLTMAATKEDFPICGMDQSTFDYLLAVMCYKYEQYDQAVKYCGSIVQTRGVNAKIKDKALMLKDEIIETKKQLEEGSGS